MNNPQNPLECLSEHEHHLRKYWLGLLLLQTLSSLVIVGVSIVPGTQALTSSLRIWTILASILGGLGVSYLMFRFAYQNHGTKFLKVLVATPLLTFPIVLVVMAKIGTLNNPMSIYTLSHSIITTWMHLQLLKINKKIRTHQEA